MENKFHIRKILFAFITAAVIFAEGLPVFAGTVDDFHNSCKMVSASEVGKGKTAVAGRDDVYISANTDKGYLYLVDEAGNKLIDQLFTAVYNGMYLNRYLIVRYYGIDDFSGFRVLTGGSKLYTLVFNDDYYYMSAKFFRGAYNIICEKRDENGELKAVYYRFDGNFNLVSRFDYDASYEPDNYDCSKFAEDRLKAADEAGLLLNPLRHRNLSENVTRYELACIGVQAVLKKSGKDIYKYIVDNNISINYNKYIDIVSPDVLLAEQLGLITAGSGRYFNPETPATREETANTLYRLCRLLGVETTARETLYEDNDVIDASSRPAAYEVTGTKAGDTYIMDNGKDGCFLPDDPYSLENTIISVYNIYNYDNLQAAEFTVSDKKYIGCGTYLFQNSVKKWGAMTEEGDIIVEPLYELAGAYVNKAVDNVFVLADEINYYSNRNTTYYVFDTAGNLLKTLHYGAEEMKADGQPYGSTYVWSATGSNLLYWTHYGDMAGEGFAFLKRLMSEETAATEYDDVVPYGNEGLFKGEIPSTGEKVILYPDGTFKEYYTEEETTVS